MKIKHTRRLLKTPFIKNKIKASRKIILPGFEGSSLYAVSKLFFRGITDGALTMRAASLSFSFFTALFPSIIFLFTLIPYIPIPDFKDFLFNLMQTVLPKAAFEGAKDTIIDIIKNPHGGLLSFGFISALLFSTNGFSSMIQSFNETFHTIETRSFLQQRLVALAMVIISTILISLAIALIIVAEVVATQYIHTNYVSFFLIHLSKFIILILLCFCFISFNYYLGPKQKQGLKFFSPGSILATFLILVATLVFAYYVNNFGSYNRLYGSIGALLIVMLWIYIVSLILLIGFDLNVSITIAHKKLKEERKVLQKRAK